MKHTVDTTEVESGWMALRGHDPNRRMVKATLVIGDERVFTESEVRAAAMAEPVLPSEMPDEMWEACRSDRATMQEAMRVVVRLTRDGILGRLLDPA
jgi:hypothetical protein